VVAEALIRPFYRPAFRSRCSRCEHVAHPRVLFDHRRPISCPLLPISAFPLPTLIPRPKAATWRCGGGLKTLEFPEELSKAAKTAETATVFSLFSFLSSQTAHLPSPRRQRKEATRQVPRSFKPIRFGPAPRSPITSALDLRFKFMPMGSFSLLLMTLRPDTGLLQPSFRYRLSFLGVNRTLTTNCATLQTFFRPHLPPNPSAVYAALAGATARRSPPGAFCFLT
jgi:hypothetical protein